MNPEAPVTKKRGIGWCEYAGGEGRSNAKSEIRNPKSESNPNDEIRNPNQIPMTNDEARMTARVGHLHFVIRISSLIRISDFGFRIFDLSVFHEPDLQDVARVLDVAGDEVEAAVAVVLP